VLTCDRVEQIPGPEGTIVRIKDAERKKKHLGSKGHYALPPFPAFLPGEDDKDGDLPAVLTWQGKPVVVVEVAKGK